MNFVFIRNIDLKDFEMEVRKKKGKVETCQKSNSAFIYACILLKYNEIFPRRFEIRITITINQIRTQGRGELQSSKIKVMFSRTFKVYVQ